MFDFIDIRHQRFRNIPSFYNELVLIMDEVMELLPSMELILKRITDREVQDISRKFFEFVVVLSNNLNDYASKLPLSNLFRSPCSDSVQGSSFGTGTNLVKTRFSKSRHG